MLLTKVSVYIHTQKLFNCFKNHIFIVHNLGLCAFVSEPDLVTVFLLKHQEFSRAVGMTVSSVLSGPEWRERSDWLI